LFEDTVFWDVVPRSPVEASRIFRGNLFLHVQGITVFICSLFPFVRVFFWQKFFHREFQCPRPSRLSHHVLRTPLRECWNWSKPDYSLWLLCHEATVRFAMQQTEQWKTNIQREKYLILGKWWLEDYRLIAETFARPSDTESYAGGSVSS
jgi:hypothetical protein